MITSAISIVLASAPQAVPDTGSTGLLLGLGILATGLVVRFLKNRK